LKESWLHDLGNSDLDLNNLTLRVQKGKGGKEGIVCTTEEFGRILRIQLHARPSLEIDRRQQLSFTDYGHWWDRVDLHRRFLSIRGKLGLRSREVYTYLADIPLRQS
jgi:integrase